MGDNCEIQLPQVDTLGLDIVREDLRSNKMRLPPYSMSAETKAANGESSYTWRRVARTQRG